MLIKILNSQKLQNDMKMSFDLSKLNFCSQNNSEYIMKIFII